MNYFTKYSKTIGKTIAIITKIQITDAILFWFLRLKKFIVTSCLSPVQPHPRCKLVGSAVGLQAEKGICDYHEYYTYIFCPLHCIHNLCASQDETRGKKTTVESIFLEQKKASNFARKKDISELDYLEVDQNLLPWDDQADGAIQDAQDDVREILKRPILNLQGMSNADIKLNYGIANFEILSACDQNYARLIRALNQWGEALYQSEKLADAESIFSYALDIGSDISSTYITLGKIYAQTDRIEQIQPLIERVKKQDFFMRDTVIDKLTGIVRSYQ